MTLIDLISFMAGDRVLYGALDGRVLVVCAWEYADEGRVIPPGLRIFTCASKAERVAEAQRARAEAVQ